MRGVRSLQGSEVHRDIPIPPMGISILSSMSYNMALNPLPSCLCAPISSGDQQKILGCVDRYRPSLVTWEEHHRNSPVIHRAEIRKGRDIENINDAEKRFDYGKGYRPAESKREAPVIAIRDNGNERKETLGYSHRTNPRDVTSA